MASQKMANKMNVISIIPTGLACHYGGSAAFIPGAKLLAACCDKLILNVNHVNASDCNGMTSNTLYCSGISIDLLLEGKIGFKEKKIGYNHILNLVNEITPLTINATRASEWVNGGSITTVKLNTPLTMSGSINKLTGAAEGKVEGIQELINQVKGIRKENKIPFDAVTVYTPIDCSSEEVNYYWDHPETANIWGRVEAILTETATPALSCHVVHAPTEVQSGMYASRVMPREMCPEVISNCFYNCLAIGLHRAPHLCEVYERGAILSSDISVLITPHGCWGRPHIAATKLGIPIVVVKENTTIYSRTWNNEQYPKNVILVENYLEAAGILMSLQAGIDYRLIKDGEIG